MRPVLDIGGQAVVEGVLMKSLRFVTIAVRRKDGTVAFKDEQHLPSKNKLLNLPIIRGVGKLALMMKIGTKALLWSSEVSLGEEEEKLTKKELVLTLTLSLVIGIGLFVLLPYFLTSVLGLNEVQQPFYFNLIDGILKMLIFVAYIVLIARMVEIKRLFQYHGAEHKTVNCFEAQEDLTVENVKKHSTRHPRCGTTFVVVVFAISILVFSIIPSVVAVLVPSIASLTFLMQKSIFFSLRVVFLPLVAGVSFEFLRIGARYSKNTIVSFLLQPGFWFQSLTTREPDDRQIEVAILSLQRVIHHESATHL